MPKSQFFCSRWRTRSRKDFLVILNDTFSYTCNYRVHFSDQLKLDKWIRYNFTHQNFIYCWTTERGGESVVTELKQ
jgi:hypothetical protein